MCYLFVAHSIPRNMVQSYTAGPFRCGDAVQIKDGIVHAGQSMVDLGVITAAQFVMVCLKMMVPGFHRIGSLFWSLQNYPGNVF